MRKVLLLVDAHLELRSPSMQHILLSLPHLRQAGWEIQAWCLRSEAPRDAVEHVVFPAPHWLGPFELLYFSAAVNLYGLWRRVAGPPVEASVIHATCGTYLGAHLLSVHFVNVLWARMQWNLGMPTLKEKAKWLFNLWGIGIERIAWWSPTVRRVLAVSESIAAEVRQRAPAGLPVEVFPNSFDHTRFHPGVRALHREAMRAALGFEAADRVFIFVSQGHHERKGFWLAVEALVRLRQAGRRHLRLLVVGGNARTLETLRPRLEGLAPDWPQWVVLAGMQGEVEKFYAAADAFLFPSRFEAFSLAEIEAAACGLPLLLTAHHGVEMVLKDGINGLVLPFEPEAMGRQIARFIDEGLPPFEPGPGRGVTRAQYAAALLGVYEEVRLERKRS